MSFLGLSAAFWGLIFGIAAHLLLGLRKQSQRSRHPRLLAARNSRRGDRPGNRNSPMTSSSRSPAAAGERLRAPENNNKRVR